MTSVNDIRWPADRFYWAVLDGSLLPVSSRRRRRDPKRLGYLFEDVLPGIPMEQMHAAFQRAPGATSKFIACGLPAVVLEQVDPDAVRLSPEALPPFIDEPINPGALNLLTGRFEPGPIRALRSRWLLRVAAIVLACCLLMMLGVERRIGMVREQIELVASAKEDTLEQVLGPVALESATWAQPTGLRLIAERRRLERTRDEAITVNEPFNAAADLSTLIAKWPAVVHAETDAVKVTPTAIAVRARVPTMHDAQRFADAFRELPGWRLMQPRSESTRSGVEVALHFERVNEGGGVP